MSTSVVSSPLLLRRALGGNGLFALSSGLISLVWANPVALLLGVPSSFVLRAIGLVLLGYAGFLFWLASRPTPQWCMARLSSLLDGGWVGGFGVLLLLAFHALDGSRAWDDRGAGVAGCRLGPAPGDRTHSSSDSGGMT